MADIVADITDFAGQWREDIDANLDNRAAPETDLAFWEKHASSYDLYGGRHSPGTIEVLHRLVHPGDEVLDVGCGTGRYSLILAEHGCRVTGLDHSPAMLAIARDKAEVSSVGASICWVHQAWPCKMPQQFDVVMAAWSMYRERDLVGALEAMHAVARRRLILVDNPGAPDGAERLLANHFGWTLRIRQARCLLLAGALHQLGLIAAVHVAREFRPLDDTRIENILRLYGHDSSDVAAARECLLAHGYAVDERHRILAPSTVGIVTAESCPYP